MNNITPIAERSAKQNRPIKPANPLDLPSKTFRAGLTRRKQNRAAMMECLREALVEGTDYGKIHVMGRNKCQAGKYCQNPDHFSKPSLFKPGAEKICGILGVTVHYPTLPDYEKAALSGSNFHQIIIRCELRDAAGRVVADGVGARSLAQDNDDINKALKMAEKSAHIDATLRMAGLSEVFTQDIEDMNLAGVVDPPGQNGIDKTQADVSQEPGKITQAQNQRLQARIVEFGLDRERVKAWMVNASQGAIRQFTDLTPKLYQKLDEKLEEWSERIAIQEEERMES